MRTTPIPAEDFAYLERQPHLYEQALEAAKEDVKDAKADLLNANTRLKWLQQWGIRRYGQK